MEGILQTEEFVESTIKHLAMHHPQPQTLPQTQTLPHTQILPQTQTLPQTLHDENGYTAANKKNDDKRLTTTSDLVMNLPDSPSFSHIPYVRCGERTMASWRDLKEIVFPECSGANCTIVENALKLKLQYPRNDADIHVCSARDQIEFLKLLHLVMPGTLLVNLQMFFRHLPDLSKMVAAKHHVSQDARSLECLYARNHTITQNHPITDTQTPTPKPFTITLIHFPVLKLPELSGNPEAEHQDTAFLKTCMSGEPCVDNLVTSCVPMRAVLMARSDEMIQSQQNDSVAVPQHFIPLRYILEMYPMLQLQLMKICADFVCRIPTDVMLRLCTVEEARDLSLDFTHHLTSSDVLVQWSDPFYLMSCLRNKHLKSIKEEKTDSQTPQEETVNNDQTNACLTSSDSFYESRIDSLSDCSESQYAYDADIEEIVDQSNIEDALHVTYYPIKTNVTTEILWGKKKQTSKDDEKTTEKSSITSTTDLDDNVDVQEELSYMTMKGKTAAVNSWTAEDMDAGRYVCDLTSKDDTSDDSLRLNILNTFSLAESQVYDPDLIAIQLLEEEQKLNRADNPAERVESVADDAEMERANEIPQCQETEYASVETEGIQHLCEKMFFKSSNKDNGMSNCNENIAGMSFVDLTDAELSELSGEITRPASSECNTRNRSSANENEEFCDHPKEMSPSERRTVFTNDTFFDNTTPASQTDTYTNKNQSNAVAVEAKTRSSPGEKSNDVEKSQLLKTRSSKSENSSSHTSSLLPQQETCNHRTPEPLPSSCTKSASSDGDSSRSENNSPERSTSHHTPKRPSPSCRKSTPRDALQTSGNRSAKRGVKNSKGHWHSNAEVPKLYTVLTASEVARRSAEMVAIELSGCEDGLLIENANPLINTTKSSSSDKQTFSQKPKVILPFAVRLSTPKNNKNILSVGALSKSQREGKVLQFDVGSSQEQIAKKTQPLTPKVTDTKSLSSSSTSNSIHFKSSKPADIRPWLKSLSTLKSAGRWSLPTSAISNLSNSGKITGLSDVEFSSSQMLKQIGRRSLPTNTISNVTRCEETVPLSGAKLNPNETAKQTGSKLMQTRATSKLSSSERTGSLSEEPVSLQTQYQTGRKSMKTRATSKLSMSKKTMTLSEVESSSPQTKKMTGRKSMQITSDIESNPPQTPKQTGRKSMQIASHVVSAQNQTSKQTSRKSMQTRVTFDCDSSPPQTPKLSGRKSIQTRANSELSQVERTKPLSGTLLSPQTLKTGRKSMQTRVTFDVDSSPPQTPKLSGRKSIQTSADSELSQVEITKTLSEAESSAQTAKTGSKSMQTRSTSKLSKSERTVQLCDVESYPQKTPKQTGSTSVQVKANSELSPVEKTMPIVDVKSIPRTPKTGRDSMQTGVNTDVPQTVDNSCVKNTLNSLGQTVGSPSDLTESQKHTLSSDVKSSSQKILKTTPSIPQPIGNSSLPNISSSVTSQSGGKILAEIQSNSQDNLKKTPSSDLRHVGSRSSSCEISKPLHPEDHVSPSSHKNVEQVTSSESKPTCNDDSVPMECVITIFHSLLQDEIQFAVEIQMQNELNEKLNDIYSRKNQDDNTIVSCRSSKYSDIWKHNVDKVYYENYKNGENLQQNSSKYVKDKTKKKKETSEKGSSTKQVVTPLKISKMQSDNLTKNSTKWTVEKISKIPENKTSARNLEKDMSLRVNSNEKDGRKVKELKSSCESERKSCDKAGISKSTHKGKGISDLNNSSSQVKSARVLDKTRSKAKENCTNSFHLQTKRTQDVRKQQNNCDSNSFQSQTDSTRLARQGQKTNESNVYHSKVESNRNNNKEQRYDDFHSIHSKIDSASNRAKEKKNSSKSEHVKTKVNDQRCGESSSKHSQNERSKAKETIQRNSFKNSTQTNGVQKEKHNGILQSNHSGNEDSVKTGQIRNKSSTSKEQDSNVDKHFPNKSSNSQPGSSGGVLEDKDKRKVYSEEMLNAMVSTNPFAQSVESLKSLNNCRIIKEVPHENEQSKRYPGEIEIVSQILSMSIPEKKKTNSSPTYSRNPVRQPTEPNGGNPPANHMSVPMRYIAPHNVIMPVNTGIRCGTGIPRKPYPQVIDNPNSSNNLCCRTQVPSASNDFLSAPRFSGNNFMNFCSHPSNSLSASFGGQMQDRSVSFSSPLTYGTQQSLLGSSLFNKLCISNTDQTSNRLHAGPANDSGYVSYSLQNKYWHSSSFKNVVCDDMGPPSFFVRHQQNMATNVVSEPAIQMKDPRAGSVNHLTRSWDSYPANSSQGISQQKLPQPIKQKVFGECSKSVDTLGQNQSRNTDINKNVLSKRSAGTEKKTYGSGHRASHSWLSKNLNIDGSGVLGKLKSKKSKGATPASQTSEKHLQLQAGLEQQNDVAASKNVINEQHHTALSERMTNKSQTEPNTYGKTDINNNCTSEESGNCCQRMDNLCCKNSAVYPVRGSLVKNKPIKKNILEREILRADVSHVKKTARTLCTCRATIHSRPDQDEPLKKHLKMKFSLSSKHCPVHSDDKSSLYRHNMISQVEMPPSSNQHLIKINTLGERVKIQKQTESPSLTKQQQSKIDYSGERVKMHKKQRKFKTVKDRILESVKHLQETDSVDQLGSEELDDTQSGCSRVLGSSEGDFGQELNKCKNNSAEVVLSAEITEKSKQRKRSKRPVKLRKNQIEGHRTMPQRSEPAMHVTESEAADQDLFLELVAGTHSCSCQGQFEEHDLRVCDTAESKAQSSEVQSQFDNHDLEICDAGECKSQSCKGQEQCKEPDLGIDETTGCKSSEKEDENNNTVDKMERKQQDAATDGQFLVTTPATVDKVKCSNSQIDDQVLVTTSDSGDCSNSGMNGEVLVTTSDSGDKNDCSNSQVNGQVLVTTSDSGDCSNSQVNGQVLVTSDSGDKNDCSNSEMNGQVLVTTSDSGDCSNSQVNGQVLVTTSDSGDTNDCSNSDVNGEVLVTTSHSGNCSNSEMNGQVLVTTSDNGDYSNSQVNGQVLANTSDSGDKNDYSNSQVNGQVLVTTSDSGDKNDYSNSQVNGQVLVTTSDSGDKNDCSNGQVNGQVLVTTSDSGDKNDCSNSQVNGQVLVTTSDSGDKNDCSNSQVNGQVLVTTSDSGDKNDCSNSQVNGQALANTSDSGDKNDCSNSQVNGQALANTSDSGDKNDCSNSQVDGPLGTDVEDDDEIRYQPIIPDDKTKMSLRGLALYKGFASPYVTDNGFKYIPMKDAVKLFEACCLECSIPRCLMRKDSNLSRTLCNWEQVCLFDETGMSTVQPVATGDLLLHFDKLVHELPRLKKMAREKHVGTKLKKSQNCHY